MKVVIIGGGIIGLSSAYYLNQAGHEVTVIDSGNLSDGCSHGNAGMIVPSHIIPLAAPGMIAKGIRWMFNSSSPFYVKPRLSMNLLRWGFQFYQHANQKHVNQSIPALKELSLYSKSQYQKLFKDLPFDFGYHERGLLMLYQTRETEHEEAQTAAIANDFGIEARILSPEQVQQLEPDVRVAVRGGVYFPGDAHITPQALMSQLKKFLSDRRVTFLAGTTVKEYRLERNRIHSILTDKGDFLCDLVVLAAGSWSGMLARQLNLNLPMQAGKGYSFSLSNVEKNIRIPSILLESRVAVTPMGTTLRFGGTMEITGVDHSINMSRVKGIVDSIPTYYPEMNVPLPKPETVWHGLRPCSPDGLPYLGISKSIGNLIIATGHAMMGLSLGPGTGALVASMVSGKKPEVDLTPFYPERYQ